MAYKFSKEFLDSAFNYNGHRQDINDKLSKEPINESELKMLPYIKRNVALMDVFDESFRVSDKLRSTIEKAPATTWVVITEGWCGDAAYNMPMLAAIEKIFPQKLVLRIFLRDTNLELMDAYLTDGGRSVPKVIVLDEHMNEVATWGPRPAPLQQLMKQWKADGQSLAEIIPKVDAWYGADDTHTLQQELLAIVESYT